VLQGLLSEKKGALKRNILIVVDFSFPYISIIQGGKWRWRREKQGLK
jgi:hypothetical protein